MVLSWLVHIAGGAVALALVGAILLLLLGWVTWLLLRGGRRPSHFAMKVGRFINVEADFPDAG